MEIHKTLIKGGVVIISVFILTTGSCSIHRNHLVAEAIKSGADPMGASLAMRGNLNDTIAIYQLSKDRE